MRYLFNKRGEVENTKNIFVVALLLFILIIVVIIVLNEQVRSCVTEDCFYEFANDCNKVILYNDISSIYFYYETDSDCSVIKRVEAVDNADFVYLVGKEMKCTYSKKGFDRRLLTDLVSGTNACEGELKDELIALVNSVG